MDLQVGSLGPGPERQIFVGQIITEQRWQNRARQNIDDQNRAGVNIPLVI